MERFEIVIEGRQLHLPAADFGYGGETGVLALCFTGANPDWRYKLDLLNEWTGDKNVLDLENRGGVLTPSGSVSLPSGGYQLQLRTVGEAVWHSDPAHLTVKTPIDAVDAFDPAEPSEMRQLEQRVTDAVSRAEEAAVGHAPRIGENGNWQLWDYEANAYADSGKSSKGDKGAQGEKGEKGEKGDKGDTPIIPDYMDIINPSGTGALSLNRAANSTVGRMSAVLGSGNTATEQFGISLGYGNQNDGQASLAAGSSNQIKKTSATNSLNTVALGMSLQAQGNAQIVLGKHNMPMEELVGAYPKYPLVFGWGTTQGKKNILLMDNEGNIDFAGSAKANGEPLAPYPCETISGSSAETQIGAEGVSVKSLEISVSPSLEGRVSAALTVNGETTAIPFGRAVYGGTLNAVTGELTITHKMTTLSQISGWRYRSDGYFLAALPGGMYGVSSVGQKTALSSVYARANGGSHIINGSVDCAFTIGSTVLTADSCAIAVRDSAYSNVAAWLSAVGDCAIVYELAQPETVQLTPMEVRTALGANSFSSDAGDVTVTLRVDPTLAYNELKAAIIAAAE
ncbi:MAG: hypothetical protein IJS31_03760 [Oscillospiraceae bacterium]|nr:hypothetical protein [Oscillospiraceae bacterium]